MTPERDIRSTPVLAVLSTTAPASLRERLLARDEGALSELIDLASPWLLGVTQSILRDREESEEVVFEVFGTVWDRIGEVEPDPRGLMPWLIRVARNRAIDRLRRRGRRLRTADQAHSLGVLGELATAAPEVNEAATPGWHVHERIHAALLQLPEDQRAAVRLAYFHGLTHSEIAQELSIPMGTVKTRLRLAFDKLRRSLAPLKEWVQ
ncbi:MAG: RNA polymerase sigma factor [Gemmatimonadales bacterium]